MFLIAIKANLLNLSCDIDAFKYDLKSFSLEKLFSLEATVIGSVNKILYAVVVLGNKQILEENSKHHMHTSFCLVKVL